VGAVTTDPFGSSGESMLDVMNVNDRVEIVMNVCILY
jgi:hypothetical protein